MAEAEGLVGVFPAQQVELEAKAEVGVLEVLEAGLQTQVTPKEGVEAYQEFVARVFDYGAGLREEGGTESDAPHKAVPLGIVATEKMAVGKGDSQLVAAKVEMLGCGDVVVEEIQLDVGTVLIEEAGTEIIGSDGNGGNVATLFDGTEFERCRAVLAMIVPKLFGHGAFALGAHRAEFIQGKGVREM